jgi:ABC-type transporter Mla subunit MlaD
METSKEIPTVEQSLEVLSETIGKATGDLSAVRTRLDQERFEIASRNTSVSRGVVRHAERVVDHLRQADDELRRVLKDLSEREY